MVKKSRVNGKVVYVCEVCGLGYRDRETAIACQNYCSTYGACSLAITRKAVYFPKIPNSLRDN